MGWSVGACLLSHPYLLNESPQSSVMALLIGHAQRFRDGENAGGRVRVVDVVRVYRVTGLAVGVGVLVPRFVHHRI